MLTKKIKLIVLCFVAIFICQSNTLFSQTAGIYNSPYSRYGIGDIVSNSYNKNIAIGGTSIAFRSNSSVNFLNPASYTSIDTGSFVFEGGVFGNYTNLVYGESKSSISSASLSYLSCAFPITKKIKSSIGLLPYSSVGYNIFATDITPELGSIETTYTGEGGLNKIYFGVAYEPIKGLSFGANANYLFGNIAYQTNAEFPDTTNIFNSRVTKNTSIRGFNFDYGVQYTVDFVNDSIQKIKKDKSSDIRLTIGATYSNSMSLNAKASTLAERYTNGASGSTLYILDTVVNTIDKEGTIILPQSVGVGFVLSGKGINNKYNTRRWSAGADFTWQNWSEYQAFDQVDSLKNSMGVSIGGEYTHSNINTANYLSRMTYRLGAKYKLTYLQLNNTQLAEYGVSFGVGLPLIDNRGNYSSLNVGFELGKRGTTLDNLILENYAKLSVSFSIYEFWFYKKRYE